MRSNKPFFEKKVVEGDIASAAHKWAELRGWFTFKVESPTINGLPDRFYLRRGVHRFVEWKRPDGDLSAQQVKRIHELRNHGADVRVFDNLVDFMEWMR